MKVFVSIVGIFLLVGVAAGAYFFLSASPEEVIPDETNTYFPTTDIGTGSTESNRALALADGESIEVSDFIHNGITFEDPANEGMYFLAGEVEYCFEDDTCPRTGVDDFSILFNSQDQSFIVALSEEPLGRVRESAELYLMTALGISQREMCALNYSVGTTVSVNQTYASIDNLRFSFCPGATILP